MYVHVIVIIINKHELLLRLLCNHLQMKGDGKGSEDVKTELIQLREENVKLKVDCLPSSSENEVKQLKLL